MARTKFNCVIALAIIALNLSTASAQGYASHVATRKMKLADGLAVKLFASEPEVRQPILVKVDDRGRLWTIQYLQYPNPAGLRRVEVDRWSRTVYDRVPEPPPHGPRGADRITILEDTDGDGRADRSKDFVDGLNLATGLAFGHGGVFVLQVPYLLFYPDKNRDDVPDSDPAVLLKGFGMEDAQSLANHLTWGPDGWLYGVNGSTTTCNVRGIEFQQGCWRYHPVTRKFELFCEGGGNTFGLTFDENGNLFYSTNGGPFVHAVQGAYYYKSFGKHGPLHNLHAYGYFGQLRRDQVPGGPPTGGTIYLGDSFPNRLRDKFIAGNFLGHTASWWQVKPLGSTFEAMYGGVLLDSRDTWFGPTDMCTGPDGAMYVCDFHDPRTSHPDPDARWDRSNGRIYKIQAEGSKPRQTKDIRARSSEDLIKLLSHPNRWFGDRARVELATRRDRSVIPQLREILSQDNLTLQTLWALYVSGGYDDDIAAALLKHEREYVRSWAVRLLGDDLEVSPRMGRRLIQLAEQETSPIVRCQLAATSKRLPGQFGLPIAFRLLSRDLDRNDPFNPLLLWWAIESKAVSDIDRLLDHFTRAEAWQVASNRDNIQRLMRRWAAEGTRPCYDACLRLLKATPADYQSSMYDALSQGLSERSHGLHGIGQNRLYEQFAKLDDQADSSSARNYEPVTKQLCQHIVDHWQVNSKDSRRIELALRADVDSAYTLLLDVLADQATDSKTQIAMLQLLVEFGKPDSVPIVLPMIDASHSPKVRSLAITVLS